MNALGLRSRVLALAGLLALGFAGVLVRVAQLQVVRHGELAALAERQYARTVILPARRGPILDRHGVPLAVSGPAESLFAQPRAVGDPVRVAARLAPVLGMPEAELRAALLTPRPFVWIRRRLPPHVAAEVRALREPGLGLVSESLRLYPHRELGAHVLGFEGVDGGLEGVERAWDEVLAGTPGRAVVGRDGLGRELLLERVLQPPTEGRGVGLSLDVNIQYVVERELDAAWRRTGARAAMAVALDPRTGDILALAVRPTFNPNRFLEASPEVWRNRAITDPFEPGSTFKPIVAAAALEEGVVRPEDRIFAEEGRITIARTTIRDWKPYGWLTVAEVLQHSSNVGAIKVGLAVGPARLYRYATAFGFGAPTGVGLSGESRGVLRDPSRWSALSLPALSIGQEVSVTALQLVAAFAAIANGGTLMRPRLVRAVMDGEGRELRRVEPVAVRQVISPATARTLTHLLVQVVERGTGQRGAIPGYTVAGKTGTAQKLDPVTRRYSHRPGVLSFVGFAPAEPPRFVLLVALDEPRTERWGSEAAAPVFAAIGREILRYLDVPPSGAGPVQIVTGPGLEHPGGARIQLASTSRSLAGPEFRSMPDVRGWALRPALEALAPLGLPVQARGQGVVVGQRPAPGAATDGTTVVQLTLAPRGRPGSDVAR